VCSLSALLFTLFSTLQRLTISGSSCHQKPAGLTGVYVEEGPDRDSLTAALSKEGYIPVYLDEKTVSSRQQSFPDLLQALGALPSWQYVSYCRVDVLQPLCHAADRPAPSAGGPALQRLLQQCAVGAVPLRAAQHRDQAVGDAHAAVPVGRVPGRQQVRDTTEAAAQFAVPTAHEPECPDRPRCTRVQHLFFWSL
jgi:hypothetical protein